MGELEEKETGPSETTQQQEAVDEPKETDKMLGKKEDADGAEQKTENASAKDKNLSPNTEKKKAANSKPITPIPSTKKSPTQSVEKLTAGTDGEAQPVKANGGSGEEIIDILEAAKTEEGDEKKISTEEREVKPMKIPIGGLKLPGFFMKNKPKADGDGADGELLERDNKDEVPTEAANVEDKPKKEEKPRSSFGERLRKIFVRKPTAEKQQTKQTANGDADAKSGEFAEQNLILCLCFFIIYYNIFFFSICRSYR